MNIHIDGEWYLESDPMNLILKQRYISKEKRSLGKLQVADRGYYQKMELFLNAVLDKEIMQSNADSLIAPKDDVARIRKLIEVFCIDKELGFAELKQQNDDLIVENKKLKTKIKKMEETKC